MLTTQSTGPYPPPSASALAGDFEFYASYIHFSVRREEYMKINIDDLNENELIELNHRIVERLKFLESAHRHKEMMNFKIGERVSFSPSGRERQFGVLVKYNKKTVSVVTEQGERWNVSPFLLSRVEFEEGTSEKKSKLIKLEKIKKKNA